MVYFLIALYSIFLVGFTIWAVLYVLPFFFGAPYVTSSDHRTEKIIKLLNPKKNEKIVDLGSGNGHLLFEIAKTGAVAYGYEINPVLVWRTRLRARQLGLENKVRVYWKNFWNVNLSKFDAIVFYQITYVMPRLEKKLRKELKPGAKIVSNYFSFPTWKPAKKAEDVLLYIKH